MKDVPANADTLPPVTHRRKTEFAWLRDAPVGAKLNAIVAVYVVSLLIFGVMVAAALELSEAVRAYVATESLWTKGQKNAVISLTRYLHSGEETDYQEYLKAVSIPLEMRRSRLELEKPDHDPARADQYLAQAGVQSAEARMDMIWLFRCCHGIEPFASAVEIWREGDEWIVLLVREAERAHARISTGLDEERFHAESQREIEAINGRLTVLEREFSFIISHAAEVVHTATLWAVFLSGAFLLLLSLLLSRQVSRYLNAGAANLNEGIRRVGLGDLEYRISPQSADELGRLAETFNDMVARRREAEVTLEQQREFLSTTLESMADGVVACDAQGTLTLFNRAAREFHGLEAEPLPPERWSERYNLYLPDGRTPIPVDQLPLVCALRGKVVRDTAIIIAPAGRPRRSVICSGRRIESKSGQMLGAVVALRDVTRQKHAEAELQGHLRALERANADLSQFAFTAAHHLQEPLRTVMSYTQLLAKEFTGTRKLETEEYVGYVNEAVLRMRDLIEGLRAYTRVTLHELSFERTDLNRALRQALERLQDKIEASQARITHDPLPTLVVNRPLIIELFQHLIGNALKFRGTAAPVIHIGEERGESEWKFSVRDNGIGIEPRHTEQVFELFERLHTRDVYPGNGVGLTLCRRIVERHGGRIWVEPGHPGSIFRFTLSTEPIAALHKMH